MGFNSGFKGLNEPYGQLNVYMETQTAE